MLVVSLIAFCFFQSVLADDLLNVQISDGLLSGIVLKTKNDRKFSAFKGIPYARPPVGPLRFLPPVPIDPWKGTLNATNDHEVCPQKDVYRRSDDFEGQEDCLYLNVYSPKLSDFEKDPLPVMIFFHGGGYLCGGGNSHWYGPDLLLDRDVVLVVPNYRLGALGFLSTGDEVAPGNNGMKDQVLVLKWVQKNIAKFGGNPNSVTLFGESAGGSSVHYHMMSPLSRGLFHAGIMQSGTALCPWAFDQNSVGHTYSKQLAESLNCPTKSSADMLECLRKFDPKTIVDKSDIFKYWDYDPMMPFRPIVEPDIEGAFLTEHPLKMIKSGKLMDIPLVVGLTSEDGAMKCAGYENANLLDEFCERFDDIIPVSLFYDRVVKNTKPVTSEIKKFYFGDKPLNKKSLAEIGKVYTDGWILKGADDAVRLHHKYYKQPVYYYLFGYRGSASFARVFGGGDGDYGVLHADDLQYLFPVGDELFPDIIPSVNDKEIVKLMTTSWTNFARTRDPSPEVNDIIKQRWRPYSTEDGEYYFIHANSTGVRSGLYTDRMKFWRKVLYDPLAENSKDEL